MKKNFKYSNQTIEITGFHAIETVLIKRPNLIKEIFIYNTESKRCNRILTLAKSLDISINLSDSNELDKKVGHAKHQGFLAIINYPSFLTEKNINLMLKDLSTSRVLILDSIQDPRNLGACLRSALAFEFDAVIINKDGSSPINEYVFKTSVGAILNLNIFYVTNLSRSINILKDIGFWILGLDSQGEGSIFSEKFSLKTAVVLGSEGSGIRKLVKENCDHLIKIPISNKVESLNISVAAGIIMYELKKQHIN